MRDLIVLLVNYLHSSADEKPEVLTKARTLIATRYPELIKAPPEELEGDKKFTFWWRDGTRSVLLGPTADAAFTRAGYGAGAKAAVDWYDYGDVDTHKWVSETKSWIRKEPIISA